MTKFIRPTLGLLQGCILYFLIYRTSLNYIDMLFTAFVLTFPLFALQMKLPKRNTLFLALKIVIPMTLLYGLTGYYLANEITSSIPYTTASGTYYLLSIQCALSGFIVFVFYCTAIQEKCFSFPYTTLFDEAWQVILKFFFGAILVYLTWGLFLIAAQLFTLINMPHILDLVTSRPFLCIILPCFFGIAMTILQESEGVLTKMRTILLAFCKFLYPVFVVISISFLVLVPFSSTKFSDIWMVSVLLSLLNILLFNGVFQAGFERPPYARWFCNFIYTSMLLTFFYSFYVLQFPWETMNHYGFKPSAFFLQVFISILALYQLCYCLAIFFSKTAWLTMVKLSNTILALTVATLYLVMAMPWFDIAALGAKTEKERLRNHQVTTDDKLGDIYEW